MLIKNKIIKEYHGLFGHTTEVQNVDSGKVQFSNELLVKQL